MSIVAPVPHLIAPLVLKNKCYLNNVLNTTLADFTPDKKCLGYHFHPLIFSFFCII
jgi:hypothetical protein